MLVKHLEQAVIVAAKKDVRFYLKGVHINGLETVATDGHRAVHCLANADDTTPYDGALTIPRDTVVAFIKACKGAVSYTVDVPSNSYSTGYYLVSDNGVRMQFEPIDGKYPDYNRAFLNHKYGSGSVPNISFNPSYLADINKIFPKSKGAVFSFLDALQVVKITSPQHKGVSYYLMPCRV